MGTITDISNSMESIIETALSAQKFIKLDYRYLIDKNDNRQGQTAFAVRSMTGFRSDGVLRSATIDQDFEIILTDTYEPNGDDDLSQHDTLLSLADNMVDIIVKELHLKKGGIPAQILLIDLVEIKEPEFLEESNLAILRATFTIKYRKQIV